ncbi:conjugal transfer protein [Streptomyces sp. ISL-87]|uniref:conjugal transfer protein n=1 Tax=Streptomyces sp. ISL-87 TaxID=2819188 RepID=UPI001BEA1311|nr:conjugal transfer protein [Streptomyces sp. ISL-87]MBT2612740.1 conjugal transfer protein [Streptomyces sp. ISL-87]
MPPLTPPPSRVRPPRRVAAQSLRSSRPETVPTAGRTVSLGPRFARIGVWTALAAGPLALAVALAVPRTTVAQAAPAPRVDGTARPPADPAGTAAMFVDLWLRADAGTPDSAIGAAVRSLAPEAELPKRSRDEGAAPAARVVALRTAFAPDGGWTVVVAALTNRAEPASGSGSPTVAAPAARYFSVSGTGGKDGGSLAIEGAPAEVAAPEPAAVPASRFTHPVSSGGALATSLGEFVRTYLGGGQGAGLERYLSPGVRVSAPNATSYTRVDVENVTADAEQAAGDAVPGDGAMARVQVRVVGEDRAGVRWPLVYRLEVTARAGRWEVSALETGTTTPSTTTASVSGGAR